MVGSGGRRWEVREHVSTSTIISSFVSASRRSSSSRTGPSSRLNVALSMYSTSVPWSAAMAEALRGSSLSSADSPGQG